MWPRTRQDAQVVACPGPFPPLDLGPHSAAPSHGGWQGWRPRSTRKRPRARMATSRSPTTTRRLVSRHRFVPIADHGDQDKLRLSRVVIVGLGGSGSHILDLIAKTRVRQIDLYDGDHFRRHNAFRSPGAATRAAPRAAGTRPLISSASPRRCVETWLHGLSWLSVSPAKWTTISADKVPAIVDISIPKASVKVGSDLCLALELNGFAHHDTFAMLPIWPNGSASNAHLGAAPRLTVVSRDTVDRTSDPRCGRW
jgi:ThiF family